MSLDSHLEHVLIGVSNKIAVAGATLWGGSFATIHTGLANLLATPGPEIVNLCAVVGTMATVIGVAGGLVVKIIKVKQDIRESQWRMGDTDRRRPQRPADDGE